MKKIFILLPLLGALVVQNVHSSEHSDFGSFWNFQKGQPKPQEMYIKWHQKMFGKYVDPQLSKFEQEEQALLFGQIKYH